MAQTESPNPAPKASPQPELTLRAILLGLILSVVMGAANVYVGLRAGMTVSASIPAAVMAMLIFKTFFRRSSILEANQVQTAASAGESLAAGIIFTMPALVMIGYWQEFDFWMVTAIAFTGGLLGILFMIPMRRVFVTNNKELPYPEGIACAAVLRAGEDKKAEEQEEGAAKALILGGLIGAFFKAAESLVGLLKGSLEVAGAAGSKVFYFGSQISPMLVGVGFIVRLNVAALIFFGGAIGWLVFIPLLPLLGVPFTDLDAAREGMQFVDLDPNAAGVQFDTVGGAGHLWSAWIRYIGVGAMVVGGIASIFSVRRGLVEAVRELKAGVSRTVQDHSERDLPSSVIIALGIVCVVLIAWIYHQFTGSPLVTVIMTAVMIIMGFFFTAVASYIVGLVGNSNSPVSGMTITAVLFTGGVLWLFGHATGMEGMVAILGVAAVVCCVACTSGDVCNDLKTGHLVGAAPYRQQIMQVAGVAVGCLVMAPVLTLLHENTPGGIGGDELPAPQAGLFASLAQGFSGTTELPWNMIGIGAAVGIAILILDRVLKQRGSSFRAYLMPIAVGIYLPFSLSVPILIGGLMSYFLLKRQKPGADPERTLHRGVLLASGIIAGEALMGVGRAGLAALGVPSLTPEGLNEVTDTSGEVTGHHLAPDTLETILVVVTLAAAVLTLGAFWRIAQPRNES
ncbi:MAG: oligopeptide transporter, OPT family [Planctomycetota bacterium]